MQSLNLPDWVVARLQQDNPDLTQSIVDMVVWVDRIKYWMFRADADLAGLVDELAAQAGVASTDSASE